MIQTRNPAEILRTALEQCAMFAAPPDMVANLRGALAFVEIGADEEQHKPATYFSSPLTAAAPGATTDE